MQIKALQAFSYREADGDIFSVALDEIVEMDSTLANGFIADGLAEEYSGGGGGSSDFSTAEVTFLGEGAEYFYCPIMIDGYLECGVYFGSQTTEDRKYNVITYEGMTTMKLRDATVDSISGDASQDEDTGIIYINGDCTITIS